MRAANGAITLIIGAAAAAAWGLVLWQFYVRHWCPAAPLAFAITLTAVACYGWLLVWLSDRRDRETRCRRCGYILRGLVEPRCPECGESI